MKQFQPSPRRLVFLLAALAVIALHSSAAAEVSEEAQTERVHSLVLKFDNSQISVDEFVVGLQSASSRELGDDGFAFEDGELRNVIGDALVRKTKQTLLTRSSTDALDLRKAAKAVLGPRHPDSKRVDRLVYVAERAELLEASQDAVKMDRFSDEVTDPVEATIVNRRKSTMFHKMAQSANTSGVPTLALRYLSEVDREYWRDITPELLLQTLSLVASKARSNPNSLNHWPFDNENVQAAIKALELRELSESERESLHSSLAGAYAYRTLYSIERGEVAAAERYFTEVLNNRPDPSEENDDLRFEIALAAGDDASREFARHRLQELSKQGTMSLDYRLRLLMAGYYGGMFPVIFYSGIALCVAIIALVLLKPGTVMVQRASGAARVRQARVRGAGYMHSAGATDEYSRLLALFNLDDTASKEDIKRAYRQLAKDYHPDRMQGKSAEEQAVATERFDELKRAYDRILEFKQAQFGSFTGDFEHD